MDNLSLVNVINMQSCKSKCVTRGKRFSGPNSKNFCRHDLQIYENTLLDATFSRNIKSSYETGLRSFKSFPQAFRYQLLLPPTLNHTVEFIAYLFCNGYSYSMVRTYISSISFQNKVQSCLDVFRNFLVVKHLEDMKRIKNCRDTRLPISHPLLT